MTFKHKHDNDQLVAMFVLCSCHVKNRKCLQHEAYLHNHTVDSEIQWRRSSAFELLVCWPALWSSFNMNSLWRLNVLKHRSFVCVMGGVDPFCTIEPAEWSECSNMISKCRPGIVQTFCSSLFCPHPPTTIIQADYNKTQSGFFENHLALVWLITYWWCNARSVFYIRGRETDKKSFHVNNPLCFYNNPIKIALVFLVQPTVYLWLHAILRWPRQIKSFKGLICDFYVQ